jgi:hypothetical protein
MTTVTSPHEVMHTKIDLYNTGPSGPKIPRSHVWGTSYNLSLQYIDICLRGPPLPLHGPLKHPKAGPTDSSTLPTQ